MEIHDLANALVDTQEGEKCFIKRMIFECTFVDLANLPSLESHAGLKEGMHMTGRKLARALPFKAESCVSSSTESS